MLRGVSDTGHAALTEQVSHMSQSKDNTPTDTDPVSATESSKAESVEKKVVDMRPRNDDTMRQEWEDAIDQALEPLKGEVAKLSDAFDSVDERLQRSIEEVTKLQEQFGGQFDSVDSSLSQMQDSLNSATEKLGAQENSLAALSDETQRLGGENAKLSEALREQADAANSRVEELQFQLSNRMIEIDDASVRRHENVVAEQASMTRQLERLSERQDRLASDIEAGLDNLRGVIAAISDELQAQMKQAEEAAIKREQAVADQLAEKLDSRTAEVAKAAAERSDAVELASTERDQELASALELRTEEIRDEARVLAERLSAQIEASADEQRTALNELDGRFQSHADEIDKRLGMVDAEMVALHAADAAAAERSGRIESQVHELDGGLQKQVKLLAGLTDTVGTHFKVLGLSVLALIVAAVLLSAYQASEWRTEAETNAALEERIAASEQRTDALATKSSADVAAVSAQQSEQFVELQERQDKLSAMHEELSLILAKESARIDQLDEQVVAIEDRADSINGRLNVISPLSQFGADNTIHGERWLAKQDPESFVIRFAQAADKAGLYKLADRYNFYLKQQLAYVDPAATDSQRYELLIGPFTERSEAEQLLRRLPRASFDHPASVAKVADIR